MKLTVALLSPVVCAAWLLLGCASPAGGAAPDGVARQVPSWSRQDLEFFLHGSMSTEFVPEAVLRAFAATYADLFPSRDLGHLGALPDPAFGWPIGFSRTNVPHLGGAPSVGVNCAACHVGDVTHANRHVRVLGMTSHFDAEAFFGAVIVATFRTAAPDNMRRFLGALLAVADASADAQQRFAAQWRAQEQQIGAVLAEDPSGGKGLAPGALHPGADVALALDRARLDQGVDLAATARTALRLFHNMRASLHLPDQPPEKAPPPSGPGRNDAFGLLAAVLFGTQEPPAPVKYGLVWNLHERRWVHWDGNTQSPIGRNLLASIGLGAPLAGKRALLDFASVQRHTTLSERIAPPRYPFAIDTAAAARGAIHYRAQCASCHDGAEGERRLYAPQAIGTDPQRASAFTPEQAGKFNAFLGGLEIAGYVPGGEPGIRSTQKYWAASLPGVWARSPYLHNGSVRTMHELLLPARERARSFRRGTRSYDTEQMGYADEGAFVLDTSGPGNSNAGHEYGTSLSASEKRDLIEFMKQL